MDYPGEKLLLKLWETLAEKGIGSLLTPWQEKRIARARIEIRREELLVLAQAEKEVESIRAGTIILPESNNIKLLTVSSADLPERIEPHIDFSKFAMKASKLETSESLRKEVNVSRALLIAEDILSQDAQEPSPEPIEDDWLFSWREYAARVSANELQDLWGRILAGEVKQPGSYSLRTLEFLKGLSKAEAELISKAAKFVISDRIFRNKESFLEKDGIHFSQLLFLQDIGILSGVEALGLTTTYNSIKPDKYFRHLIARNKVMLLEHEDHSKKIDAEVYILTKVGIEVLRLASIEINLEYFESIAKDFVTKGLNVKIADWLQTTPDLGHYSNAKDIK